VIVPIGAGVQSFDIPTIHGVSAAIGAASALIGVPQICNRITRQ